MTVERDLADLDVGLLGLPLGAGRERVLRVGVDRGPGVEGSALLVVEREVGLAVRELVGEDLERDLCVSMSISNERSGQARREAYR